MYGDEQTFKEKFRVTRKTFCVIQKQLCDAGYLRANENQNAAYQQTSDFKLAVCLYFFAGRGKGDMQAVGDAGHIGRSTVLKYVDKFVNGVLRVLKRTYMPSKAPPNERLREIRSQFASRRGIANVAMAVDGTHVPYVPPIEKFRNEYKNYKGWMSILVVAFVNSFHFFVDVDVGYPGKAGDSSVLRDSRFLAISVSGSESVRFRECIGVESKREKLTCHLQQSLTGHLGVDDVMALSELPLRWYGIMFCAPGFQPRMRTTKLFQILPLLVTSTFIATCQCRNMGFQDNFANFEAQHNNATRMPGSSQ